MCVNTHSVLYMYIGCLFIEASIKEFIDHGAVPTLIRTVINSKVSAILFLARFRFMSTC